VAMEALVVMGDLVAMEAPAVMEDLAVTEALAVMENLVVTEDLAAAEVHLAALAAQVPQVPPAPVAPAEADLALRQALHPAHRSALHPPLAILDQLPTRPRPSPSLSLQSLPQLQLSSSSEFDSRHDCQMLIAVSFLTLLCPFSFFASRKL
jgi:hypothetical protein